MSTQHLVRQARASCSTLTARAPSSMRIARALTTSSFRRDALSELDKRLNPREVIEQKRRQYEEKYGDKLKRRVESEGVRDLDALKMKVGAPSIRHAMRAKRAAQEYREDKDKQVKQAESAVTTKPPDTKRAEREVASSQAEGDRAGVKPLASILNLPLIHLTPHTSADISQIWTTYHTTHPTLSSSYLSASLPPSTYANMLSLAKQNPFFILPLPRPSATGEGEGEAIRTDSYEMFYLQWLIHPPPSPSSSPPPADGAAPAPLPNSTSVIFTPLEEFKQKGEWAQPQLVLTHYPDLANTHDLVLMRGEITAATAAGPDGSAENPGWLLSQQQAQLLALALQRFYCAGVEVVGESQRAREERLKRLEALKNLREKPQEWSWEGLVDMAYGGMV